MLGKSTLAQFFSERGIAVIDADKLGHEAYLPGTTCYQHILEHFGGKFDWCISFTPDNGNVDSIILENGMIDRKTLGSIVFGDKSKLKELENIVWPEIRTLIKQRISDLEFSGHSMCIVEAAVLVEANWTDFFDEIWVVEIPEDLAIVRLASRNGLTEEDARKRLSAQLRNEERRSCATEVIQNTGDRNTLNQRAEELLEKIQRP